jgi:hypothetical protein
MEMKQKLHKNRRHGQSDADVEAKALQIAKNKMVPFGFQPEIVKEHLQSRSQEGRKLMSGTVEGYREGLAVFLQTGEEVQRHFHRNILAQTAWVCARKRQQFFDSLVHKLAPNPEDIFVIGSGFLGRNPKKGDYKKTRGRPPIIECIQLFARHRRVVMIPEWYTSATDCRCGNIIAHKWTWRSLSSYSERGTLTVKDAEEKQKQKVEASARRTMSVRKLHMKINERKEPGKGGKVYKSRRKTHALFEEGCGVLDLSIDPDPAHESGQLQRGTTFTPSRNLEYMSALRDKLDMCRSPEALEGSVSPSCSKLPVCVREEG